MFRYICRAKIQDLKFKQKISKKVRLNLLIFTALIAISILFDFYFERHPVKLDKIETEQGKCTHHFIDLYNQVNSLNIKISVYNTASRTIFDQYNSKLQQKYNLKHSRLLNNDTQRLNVSDDLSGLQLIFGHYYHNFPDDDPPQGCFFIS